MPLIKINENKSKIKQEHIFHTSQNKFLFWKCLIKKEKKENRSLIRKSKEL